MKLTSSGKFGGSDGGRKDAREENESNATPRSAGSRSMKTDTLSLREAAFAEAARMLCAAERGDDCLIVKAERRFAQLLRVERDNPVYLAYHGAAQALRARTTPETHEQIRWIVEGVLDLNEALAKLRPEHDLAWLRGIPIAMETRLVAAGCFLALPPDAWRHQKAADLLATILASRQLSLTPPEFRASVLLRVAMLDAVHGRMDLRKTHLEEALALDPIGPAGGEALRLLYARQPQDELE